TSRCTRRSVSHSESVSSQRRETAVSGAPDAVRAACTGTQSSAPEQRGQASSGLVGEKALHVAHGRAFAGGRRCDLAAFSMGSAIAIAAAHREAAMAAIAVVGADAGGALAAARARGVAEAGAGEGRHAEATQVAVGLDEHIAELSAPAHLGRHAG